MKWLSLYLVGYLLLVAGVFLVLSTWDVLERIGPTWTWVAVLAALGTGLTIAVSRSGRRKSAGIETE